MIQRTPPTGVIERWQPELDRIAPRTTRGYSHLMLVWEPGEEWAPVERWTVWEMMRPERAPRLGTLQDLRGPAPITTRRWDPFIQRWRQTRPLTINQRQWEVYQRTGLFGRPVWIVQGVSGGHKRFWSDVEQNLILLNAGQGSTSMQFDPPAPGDLRYAEPDNRVIARLASIDLVKLYGDVLRHQSEEAENGHLASREKATGRVMAEKLWGWLGEQVAEALDDVMTREMVGKMWDGANSDEALPDYEFGEEQFKEEVATGV